MTSNKWCEDKDFLEPLTPKCPFPPRNLFFPNKVKSLPPGTRIFLPARLSTVYRPTLRHIFWLCRWRCFASAGSGAVTTTGLRRKMLEDPGHRPRVFDLSQLMCIVSTANKNQYNK